MDLKVCRCCLSAVVKLERLTELMRKVFYSICGLKADANDGHPQYVCIECGTLLRKALTIRRKTRRAHFTLKQIIMTKKVITKEDVLNVNRHGFQLLSHNGWSKPENNSVYSLLYEPFAAVDEMNKPTDTALSVCDSELQTALTESAKENLNPVKCIPEVRNNASIIVDIKPHNYKELDRIEQEKMEKRKREEEEALRQIREEDDDGAAHSDNWDYNNVNDDPTEIDLNDVFKDLKEPEIESDYSLSEPEELAQLSTASNTRSKAQRRKDADAQNQSKYTVYNGKLHRHVELANDWSMQAKLLEVIGLAKIRHMSIEEQVSAHELRKQCTAYTEAIFKCGMCVRPYASREQLHTHVKTDHSYLTDVKCGICKSRFYDLSDLGVHQAWEHWYEYTCVCGLKHYTLEDLVTCCKRKKTCSNLMLNENKIRQHHILKTRFKKILLEPQKWAETVPDNFDIEKDPTICELCGTDFTSRSKLEHHLELEYNRVPRIDSSIKYECDVCGMKLCSVEAMEYHFSRCHSHRYECSAFGCLAVFTRALDALAHRCKNIHKKRLGWRAVLNKKQFCVLCGITCEGRSNLLEHQLTKHIMIIINAASMGDAKFVCCNTWFTNEKAYHTHLLSEGHAAAKNIPLACVKCKILLADESEKDAHAHHVDQSVEQLPLSAEDFKCQYCGVMCTSRVNLSRHKADVHKDGEVCDICGNTYVRGGLYNHKRSFHESRADRFRYACELCPESFTKPFRLVMHVFKLHTLQPYVCAVCGHRTVEKKECKKHILTVHAPEKPYECSECGAAFPTTDRHNDHLKRVHGTRVPRQGIFPRGKFSFMTLLCYPHMKIDGTGIPMDIIQKCGLSLIDYKELTQTKVPPERIADYFIFAESEDLKGKESILTMQQEIEIAETRRERNRKYTAKRRRQQRLKKMAAHESNIKDDDNEFDYQKEIVLSYVRNDQGEFELKFENKKPETDYENAGPLTSENTNEQESKVALKYGNAEIHSPKPDKRKHKTQHAGKSDKRLKKQTFVGTRTKPQTGKSLGVIDGFGDIVEGYNPNDTLIENKTLIHEKKDDISLNFSETGAYDNTSGLFNQTITSDHDISTNPSAGSDIKSEQNQASGNNNIARTPNYTSGPNISGVPSGSGNNNKSGPRNIDRGPNYTSGPNNISGVASSTGNNNKSGPRNIDRGPNYTSGPNNISGVTSSTGNNNKSGPNNNESETSVEETRLEIDAQELRDKYDVVEIDGVQFVSIDNVLYKVEYS